MLGDHLVDVGDLLLDVQLGIDRHDLDVQVLAGGDQGLLEGLQDRLSCRWIRETDGVLRPSGRAAVLLGVAGATRAARKGERTTDEQCGGQT
ncbi:MAG TPA: hypothetical protein VIL77_00950 [Gaiellaceae bacterium]